MFEPVRTFAEVAEIMGVSRQRVQQIEKAALAKIARILAEKGWTPEDVSDL